jgi:hypothetical protein
MPKIDEDKRREWLRALRRFKYGIRVRAKLGVLHTFYEQVEAERRGKQQWDAPDWSHQKWVTLLYTCIKDNEFPPELLLGFVKTVEVIFMNPHRPPTVDDLIAAVNDVCRQQSKALRQRFSVFV